MCRGWAVCETAFSYGYSGYSKNVDYGRKSSGFQCSQWNSVFWARSIEFSCVFQHFFINLMEKGKQISWKCYKFQMDIREFSKFRRFNDFPWDSVDFFRVYRIVFSFQISFLRLPTIFSNFWIFLAISTNFKKKFWKKFQRQFPPISIEKIPTFFFDFSQY